MTAGRGNTLRVVATVVGITSLGLVFASTPSYAQPQSPAQTRCLTLLSKRVAKLVKVQGGEIDACAHDLARNGGNAFACLTSDSKGKIAKAAQKLAETDLDACSATIPDFGYVGSADLIAAATAHRIAMVETSTSVGELLDADADCARVFLKGASKLLNRKLRAVSVCVADGLSEGSIQSAGDVAACLSALDESTDPRLAKISSSLNAKMVSRGCSPNAAFGCYDGVEACSARITTCRACETLRLGSALTVDCSLIHDGTLDYACVTTCGDGETAAPYELCDDGNLTGGDGCDATCVPTECGNGVTTPGEFCDSAYGDLVGGICVSGAYDGLPCASNDECSGGYCTSCPNRYSCEADCGSCGPPSCRLNAPAPGCSMVTGACIGQICGFLVGPCDGPECGTEGNCTVNGYCVPTTPAACVEYEGIVGSCILGP
jgi:cysteine-rich repeat protein